MENFLHSWTGNLQFSGVAVSWFLWTVLQSLANPLNCISVWTLPVPVNLTDHCLLDSSLGSWLLYSRPLCLWTWITDFMFQYHNTHSLLFAAVTSFSFLQLWSFSSTKILSSSFKQQKPLSVSLVLYELGMFVICWRLYGHSVLCSE